jgi:hypothetical protein
MTQTKEQKLKHKSLSAVADFMDSKVRDLKNQMWYNKRELRNLHEKQFQLKRQLVEMTTLANTLRK